MLPLSKNIAKTLKEVTNNVALDDFLWVTGAEEEESKEWRYEKSINSSI